MAGAIANVDSTRLDGLPRMADVAIWVTAAEPGLGWESQSFMRAYHGNRGEGHELAIEASAIGPALRIIADQGFEGTASELLERLDEGRRDEAETPGVA